MKFRKCCFEFTPQLDVEMPTVNISEEVCAISSYGAVYDIALQTYDEEKIITTLTVEELVVVRDYINYLLNCRDKDVARQGQMKGFI